MKNIPFILLILLITSSNVFAQTKEDMILCVKKDNTSYLYINNSDDHWYTVEFKTDTLYKGDRNFIYKDPKNVYQIFSNPFDNGKPMGVMGDSKGEKQALKNHKQKELEYFENLMGEKLKSKGSFYNNTANKPFLIWWFKNKVEETTDKNVIKVTHSLFMDFVIHGRLIVTISRPVFEDQKIEDNIKEMEEIANSLNVYGFFMDPKALSHKLRSNNPYAVQDKQQFIDIQIPSRLNVIKSPENILLVTFPEKENIINSAVVIWEYKSEDLSFEDFKQKHQEKNADENSFQTLVKEDGKEEYFYTKKNDWFHCKNTYLEGDDIYCFIHFTATKSTYKFNIERLNELINNITLK